MGWRRLLLPLAGWHLLLLLRVLRRWRRVASVLLGVVLWLLLL